MPGIELAIAPGAFAILPGFTPVQRRKADQKTVRPDSLEFADRTAAFEGVPVYMIVVYARR